MEKSFIDELLLEEEAKEEERTECYYDLLLVKIKELNSEIANNFCKTDKEISIIKEFSLRKNSVLQERIRLLERKLEAYIRERQVKTIELPNGTIKLHKKPEKVEISDLEMFLKHAKPEMLTIIPEQIKPDMTKIKTYMRQNYTPAGVTVTEGKEEFSYKIKEVKEDDRAKETGAGTKPAETLRIAV